MHDKPHTQNLSYIKAFTLIEMAVVIVIIGLLTGGILVGKNLIASSEIRATIAQLDNYARAVNAFEEKFGALPGDLNSKVATNFGFAARGSYPGEGDGNGIIEGVQSDAASKNSGSYEATGETVMFWSDLTYANGQSLKLISGFFNLASSSTVPSATISGTRTRYYFPTTKIGKGNYVYVWSSGKINYFGLSSVSQVTTAGAMSSTVGLTVSQAGAIDNKIDDGLPQVGTVTAQYINTTPSWAGTTDTSSTAGSSTTCYDNNSTANAAQQYSFTQNKGTGVNCALSFQF